MRWIAAFFCFILGLLVAAEAGWIVVRLRSAEAVRELTTGQQILAIIVLCGISGVAVSIWQYGAGIAKRNPTWRLNGRSMFVGSMANLIVGLLLLRVI